MLKNLMEMIERSEQRRKRLANEKEKGVEF